MKELSKIILLFLSLTYCSGLILDDNSDDSPCATALNQINNDLINFAEGGYNVSAASNLTKYFALLSGRYINDFGEYTVCQNQSITHYFTLQFNGTIQKSSISAVIGFCAPINCSISDAMTNIDLVYKVFKNGIGLNLKDITNASSTAFYDPTAPPPGDKATTIVIIVIFALVVSLTVAGTSLGVYYEIVGDQRSKREKELSERLLRGTENSNIGSNIGSTIINTASIQGTKSKKELTGIFKFLDCFDARKNFDKIVKIKYTETYDFNLEMFNGIRVFMMLYVVYGHSVLFGTDYVDNLVDIPGFANSAWLLIPYSALYAVDVFFYMSGFLFAYIGVGKLKKMKPTPLNYLSLALHRFLRIWPTYVLAILFFWRILPLLSEGPIWFQMTDYTSLCEGTVWQNLLFLDDILVQSADYCFGWGWYLSNDFQMFLMTPFFLWLYIRNKRAGKIAMTVLICISLGLALWIGAVLNVKGSPPKVGDVSNGAAFSEYYVKPYIRLPPYFIGILVALFYKEFREEYGSSYKIGYYIKSRLILSNLIQFSGFLFMVLLTFLPRPVQVDVNAWPDWFHVTWRAFQKSAYVVALSMLILPSLLGEKTLLKKFLSQPLLVPLARLSFTAYLVHLFWVYQNYYNSTSSFHYSYPNVLYVTIANGVIAFSVGMILSLLAEVPTANIEATYISAKRPARSNRVKPDQVSQAGGDGSVTLTSR